MNDITPLPSPSDDHINGQLRHTDSLPSHEQEPLDGTPTIPIPTTFDPLGLNSSIDELKTTAQFIEALRGATLEQSNMRQEDIEQMCIRDRVEEIQQIGKRYNASAGQVTLAWLLAQGPDVIPIPGTRNVKVGKTKQNLYLHSGTMSNGAHV